MPETYDQQNLRRRRELYRLIVAKDSIHNVAMITKRAETEASTRNNDSELVKALHDSLVASYGRAFVDMEPFGRISSNWTRFDSEEMQKTHDMLMHLRMKSVAHTDHIEGKIVMYPKGATRSDGLSAGKVQYEVLSQTFAGNAYIPIQKLAGALVGRLDADISSRMTALFGDAGYKLKNTEDLVSSEDIEKMRNSQND